MKGEPVFIDTNIIAYAYDKSEPRKHLKCVKIIEQGFMGEKNFYISNQILAELASVLLNKIQKTLPEKDVKEIIEEFNLSNEWKKLNYTTSTVEKAVTATTPFWDSLIAETMKENNISTIYTENTKDFKKISGINTINPV